MEASNKLMLAFHVGQRTQANAHVLVHTTVSTLAKGCIPTYATDGLKLYYYALTAHYGAWVDDETLLPASYGATLAASGTYQSSATTSSIATFAYTVNEGSRPNHSLKRLEMAALVLCPLLSRVANYPQAAGHRPWPHP